MMRDYLKSFSFIGEDYADYALYGIAAVAAIIVLLLVWWIIKLLRTPRYAGGRRSKGARIAITDAARVDERHNLILVRRDDVEHLVMIGAHSDLLIESNIRLDDEGRTIQPEPAIIQIPTPAPAPTAAPSVAPAIGATTAAATTAMPSAPVRSDAISPSQPMTAKRFEATPSEKPKIEPAMGSTPASSATVSAPSVSSPTMAAPATSAATVTATPAPSSNAPAVSAAAPSTAPKLGAAQPPAAAAGGNSTARSSLIDDMESLLTEIEPKK